MGHRRDLVDYMLLLAFVCLGTSLLLVGGLQDFLGDSGEDLWCRSRRRFTLCSGPPIRRVLDMSATGTWAVDWRIAYSWRLCVSGPEISD